MKHFFIILFLFTSGCAFAQQRDSRVILKHMKRLDSALIAADSVTLNKMLDRDLKYCHSTGFVQNKKAVIDDLFNGVVKYTYFKTSKERVIFLGNDAALVRFNDSARGYWNDSAVQFKLNAIMVWVYKDNRWQLMERMAVPRKVE